MALNRVTNALRRLCENQDDESDESGSSSPSATSNYQEYFCVEDSFLTRDIKVSVEEIGQLNFPLTEDTIKQLIDVSTQARFGRGEETVLDISVRNTQMIPANKIKVEIDEQCLTTVLEKLSSGLNINPDSTLIPHLYNILIYGPGQFFKLHRDSVKVKNMVATLVIVLPSAHKGGDLIIKHNNKTHAFFGSRVPDFVKCVAFYSDCQHEIKKVTEGYRVALTYNVVLQSPEVAVNIGVDEELDRAVQSYFTSNAQPKKMIYFLNHSYTQHSLRWGLLKGNDRTTAYALFSVAKKQDRIPFLALAECMETLDAEDEESDVLYSSTTLNFWVDKNNIESKEQSYANEEEICYTVETTELFEPFKTEESGPTGNEGETKDNWYKRACVVLWSDKWVSQNGFRDALCDLHHITNEPGKERHLLEEIEKVKSRLFDVEFWKGQDVKDMLLDIVIYLKNNTAAVFVLSKLPFEVLDENNIDRFIRLETLYNAAVWNTVLTSWREIYGWKTSLKKIMSFIQSYTTIARNPSNSAVVGSLLIESVENFISSNKPVRSVQSHYGDSLFGRPSCVVGYYKYGRTSDETIKNLSTLLQLCLNLGNTSLVQKLLDHIKTTPSIYLPVSVAELFFKLKSELSPSHFLQLKMLKEVSLSAVQKDISELNPVMNSYYLPITMPCRCEYCSRLQAFFHSSTNTSVVVPAAKHNRAHVYSYLNPLTDYPIKFHTERTGSPYKIIVEKLSKVFEDRQKLRNDLTILERKLHEVEFTDTLASVSSVNENIDLQEAGSSQINSHHHNVNRNIDRTLASVSSESENVDLQEAGPSQIYSHDHNVNGNTDSQDSTDSEGEVASKRQRIQEQTSRQ